MASKIESMQEELKTLITQGNRLYFAMVEEIQGLSANIKKKLKEEQIILPNFRTEYDTWYSEALVVIKQILPDRLADFVRQYRDEKRTKIDFLTYGIADYLYNLQTKSCGETVADGKAAVSKMQNQYTILLAAEKRFNSSLFDIKEIVQADIFDSELNEGKELAKKGFFRAGGVVAGVVIEKHLSHVCEIHKLTISKKHPCISDYNNLLQTNKIIDIPMWRFIQRLGDLRNLCGHKKDREPTKNDVLELIQGVEKIIKEVW